MWMSFLCAFEPSPFQSPYRMKDDFQAQTVISFSSLSGLG